MFCNKCGYEMQSGAIFCNQCGSSSVNEMTIEKDEAILGVYPMDFAGGIANCYDVYFTNQRFIADYKEKRLLPRFWGFGCILWPYYLIDFVIVAPITRRKERGSSTIPEQILKSDRRNFACSFSKDIQRVKFSKRVVAPFIDIKLSNGHNKKVFYPKQYRDELIRLFEEIIPNKTEF